MRSLNLLHGKGVKILIALLLLSTAIRSYGQTPTYSYYYRVYFNDKGDNLNYSPEDLLSSRALYRRHKAGIPVPDYKDFPVNKNYLNTISSAGYKLHCTSKWMNTALFKTQFSANISSLLNLPFVHDIKIVKSPGKKGGLNNKLDFQVTQADPTAYDRPVTMLNGKAIHNSGYDGRGILIAILDGGFTYADQISSLISLRSRNGVKKTFDFIKNSDFVYSSSSHGTAVLSVLAGNKPEFLEGTAPGADYLLLKTEDVDSEYPVEEDFWAAGAEYADSTGADIISSSLGYYYFDDPSMNYKYSDLDGKTAFVTRVADIAASKGILVVNSAGNERNKEWKRIIFPSDGKSVLAVGAVDANNNISAFSSAGPSYDGRVKPDNAAMGVNVPVQVDITTFGRSSGTSFSCPILSGMAACLLQAVPKALNTDIIEVLRTSADKYNLPDSLYGYGIPDMVTALVKLQDKYVTMPLEESVIGPNPTTGSIEIIFRQPPEILTIEIVSMTGKMVYRNDYQDYAGRSLVITELQNSEQGMYFIRIIKGTVEKVYKIIKLRN